jgi:hypothetical protein
LVQVVQVVLPMEHQILEQVVPSIVKHLLEVVKVQVRLIQRVLVDRVVQIVLLLQEVLEPAQVVKVIMAELIQVVAQQVAAAAPQQWVAPELPRQVAQVVQVLHG